MNTPDARYATAMQMRSTIDTVRNTAIQERGKRNGDVGMVSASEGANRCICAPAALDRPMHVSLEYIDQGRASAPVRYSTLAWKSALRRRHGRICEGRLGMRRAASGRAADWANVARELVRRAALCAPCPVIPSTVLPPSRLSLETYRPLHCFMCLVGTEAMLDPSSIRCEPFRR